MAVNTPNIIALTEQSVFAPVPFNFAENTTYKTSVDPANVTTKLTDRREDTFEGPGTYILKPSLLANVDHLYIKGSGIGSIQVTGAGTGVAGSPFTVDTSGSDSEYAVTDSNGEATDYTIGNISHYLFGLNRTAHEGWLTSQITIVITGTGAKVYEIAAMNAQVKIPFSTNSQVQQARFDPVYREPTKRVHTDLYGDSWPAVLGSSIDKYDILASYAYFRTADADNPSATDVYQFFKNNVEFSFIANYPWNPNFVFTRAFFAGNDIEQFRQGTKLENYRIALRIREC